jgi:hypothetical protein
VRRLAVAAQEHKWLNQREILADANMAEAIGLPMKKRKSGSSLSQAAAFGNAQSVQNR